MNIELNLSLSSQNPVLAKGGSTQSGQVPVLTAGDKGTLILRFWDGTNAKRLTNFSVIKFGSKVSIQNEEAVLFIDSFTESQDTSGYLYSADLNLNTVELLNAITGKNSITVFTDVEITYANGDIQTLQFSHIIRNQVITSTTPSVGISENYPAPSQVAVKITGAPGKLLQHSADGSFEDSTVSAFQVPLTTDSHNWTAKQNFLNGFGIYHTDGTPLLNYTTSTLSVIFQPPTGKQWQWRSADNNGLFQVTNTGVVAQYGGNSLVLNPYGQGVITCTDKGEVIGGNSASLAAYGSNNFSATTGGVAAGGYSNIYGSNYSGSLGFFSGIWYAPNSFVVGNSSNIYGTNSIIVGSGITSNTQNSIEIGVLGTASGATGTGEGTTEGTDTTGETTASSGTAFARISMRGDSSQVAISLPQTDTWPNPAYGSPGSEAANELAPSMMAFRLSSDGNSLVVSVNVGGTIKNGTIPIY